jgi:hypothetical protein
VYIDQLSFASLTATKPAYGYLDKRARLGAPAKANKKIALLSAVLEYGRRRGEIEVNRWRGIEDNPTRPRTRYAHPHEIAVAIEVARSRMSVGDKHSNSTYLILALCVQTAYLAVSRPTEIRELRRKSRRADGITVPIGKRKASEPIFGLPSQDLPLHRPRRFN